jgi:hypothetical protein
MCACQAVAGSGDGDFLDAQFQNASWHLDFGDLADLLSQ